MALTRVLSSQLPVQGKTLCVAHSLAGDNLATSSSASNGSLVQIWKPDFASKSWALASQVQVPTPATSLAWANPESGLLLAASTDNGQVFVLEAPRPMQAFLPGAPSMSTGIAEDEEEVAQQKHEWRIQSTLQAGSAPIRHLSFAPRQHGLLLCTAGDDGGVTVWEADRPLAPDTWSPLAKFQVGRPVKQYRGNGASHALPGISLAWRPFSPSVPPMLVVGSGEEAHVWQYAMQLMTWKRCHTLKPSSPAAITGVHWAPHLSRPQELVAVSHGSIVDVFGLQGESSTPGTELLATLSHGAGVWKLEFNQWGTCLAVATEDASVTVWRANLVGDWDVMCVVQGSSEVGGDQTM